MGKKTSSEVLEPLVKKRLEGELIERIRELGQCGSYIKVKGSGSIVYFDTNYIADPIPFSVATDNTELFGIHYNAGTVKSRFILKKSEINRIVDENTSKAYLHVFFINSRNSENTLALALRFSDLPDFDDLSLLDIKDFEKESAYWLLDDGTMEAFDIHSDKFSELYEKFDKGIGKEIIKATNAEVTRYVVYEMAKIKAFNGFEHDLNFEVVCVKENGKIRMALQVLVKDSDRVHHYDTTDTGKQAVYEGYYDLGNLKP